jgi:hypothetical protein
MISNENIINKQSCKSLQVLQLYIEFVFIHFDLTKSYELFAVAAG